MDAPAPAETTIRLADPADTDTVLSLIREKAENDGSSAMLDLDHGRLRSALSGPSPAVAALLAEQWLGGRRGHLPEGVLDLPHAARPVAGGPVRARYLAEAGGRVDAHGRIVPGGAGGGAVRVDWAVRVTNERAIELYASLGAELRDKFTLCRLDADGIVALARQDRS